MLEKLWTIKTDKIFYMKKARANVRKETINNSYLSSRYNVGFND